MGFFSVHWPLVNMTPLIDPRPGIYFLDILGALVMLYVQLIQVLLLHPLRNRSFWTIVVYSFGLLPLTFASFVGQAGFAEILFTLHEDYPGGGIGYLLDHPSPWSDNLNQIRCVDS